MKGPVVKRKDSNLHELAAIYTMKRRRYDQTALSVSERFTMFSTDHPKPFILDETITIEIERKVDGNEPFVIPYFHSEAVIIVRGNDEGAIPFHLRDEFQERDEEFSERRIVKVVGSGLFGKEGVVPENFDIRRDLFESSSKKQQRDGKPTALYWKSDKTVTEAAKTSSRDERNLASADISRSKPKENKERGRPRFVEFYKQF